MVPSLLGSFVLVSIAGIAALALFLVAMARRWFAALPSGFLVVLIVAFVGLGVFTLWLSGAWGYRAARQIVFDQVVLNLQNIGGIVEQQIKGELDDAFEQLHHLASELPAVRLYQIPAGDLEQTLREVAHVNTHFLQLDIVDDDGKRLAGTSSARTPQPLPRIPIAYCLGGTPFASDPYFSDAFPREGHHEREHIMDLCVPITAAYSVVGVLVARFDVQDNLIDLLDSAKFNQTGRATLVGNDGHVLADPNPARLNADLTASPAVREALSGKSSFGLAAGGGEPQIVFYRQVTVTVNAATMNPKPWALLTEIGQADALAPLDALARQIGLGIVGIALASILVAWAISWSITRPVGELVTFVRRVQGGDLTAQVQVGGRDAFGQLGQALNAMVIGLRERDRVKDVFGRYVATQVSEQVLKGELNLGGERRRVTILFSDIRDFTGMSERLSPEEVVAFLNNYFSEMVEAVFDNGGMLDKFIGDGLMAVFGATGDQADHPHQAVSTALRMKSLLAKINGERAVHGLKPIKIGVGVHTDEVIVGNIGSRKRLEYTVIGDGVNTASRLESMNKELGTTILISQETYDAVKDKFVAQPMQPFHVKGKEKELTAYEVLSMTGDSASP